MLHPLHLHPHSCHPKRSAGAIAWRGETGETATPGVLVAHLGAASPGLASSLASPGMTPEDLVVTAALVVPRYSPIGRSVNSSASTWNSPSTILTRSRACR